MRIHQIAPPYLSVGSNISYGGVERVMFQLDRALLRLGHKTSMSATAGSKPYGRFYETVKPIGIGDSRTFPEQDEFYLKLDNLEKSIRIANDGDFDVVHTHEESLLPFLDHIKKPIVYTIHSSPEEFWKPRIHPEILELQKGHKLVAVSQRIRDIYNRMGFEVEYVVHNGFDIEKIHFSENKLDYLLMLGIILPKKGQNIAVSIAKNLEMPLIIAGNVGDRDYFSTFKSDITHSIEDQENKLAAYNNLPKGRKIVYAGHVNDKQKFPLFAHAKAVIVPSTTEDPLPGVVIEGMACGAPVIGLKMGGIPEMVVNGITGYVARDLDEMSEFAELSDRINPANCRSFYESHFTSEAMARNYLKVYEEVMKNG